MLHNNLLKETLAIPRNQTDNLLYILHYLIICIGIPIELYADNAPPSDKCWPLHAAAPSVRGAFNPLTAGHDYKYRFSIYY